MKKVNKAYIDRVICKDTALNTDEAFSAGRECYDETSWDRRLSSRIEYFLTTHHHIGAIRASQFNEGSGYVAKVARHTP